MANQERGERTITVGGRDYIVKLTTGAMAELEDACGTPDKPMTFPQILERVMRGSVKYLRLYVWASLIDKQPELTVADAGRLIDAAGGVAGFESLLNQVTAANRPDPEDLRPQTAQATTTAIRGTGARSTSKRVRSA